MTGEYKLLIDGELVEGAHKMGVVDPATGRAFANVPTASREQAEMVVAAAKRALPGWSQTPLEARRAAILEMVDRMGENEEELARALVLEQGKPLPEARIEIQGLMAFARYFATVDLPRQVYQDDFSYHIETHHRPLGVVVGIAPWNYPFFIGAVKLVPAVLMGNTFIMKPAPTTPITMLMLGQLIRDIFPKGVVNVIVDNNDLGGFLTQHPDVAKISFTGSTATGKKVQAAAAASVKRVTLELGGNDAGIVLDDADVGKIAPKIFNAAFANAGQVCIALKRVYAPSSIYDKLCRELARLADEAVVGSGFEQGTTVGPLQNAAQYAKAKNYLEIAHRDGKVIAGGDVVNREGFFVRPTIVRDIDDSSPLVAEEQFAPILPIIKYDSLDEALAKANNTSFGLGGSVWSNDEARAVEIAKKVESGTVWVNHHLHFAPNVPLGGAKESGIGVDYGVEGLMEFVQTSIISVAK